MRFWFPLFFRVGRGIYDFATRNSLFCEAEFPILRLNFFMTRNRRLLIFLRRQILRFYNQNYPGSAKYTPTRRYASK